MARAQAGQFDEALARFRELMQGLGQNEQEEFAASFSDSSRRRGHRRRRVRRRAPGLHDARSIAFSDSPNLRQKVAGRPEAARQGRQAGAVVRGRGHQGTGRPPRAPTAASTSWSISGRPGAPPASPSCPGCRRPIAPTTTPASRSSASASTRPRTAVVDFAKARKIPWPQIHNASGAADLVEAFGVSSIPATYLIDPEGTIIRLDLRGKALDETLARLIKRPAATTSAR